jgi:transposase
MITREPRACASGYGVAAFALDGAEVNEEPGRGRTVWLVTAGPAARMCPVCKTASEHVREQVVTRPADIGSGQDRVSVVWVKRRWECRAACCPRKTFTESLPGAPPRCRVTERLRDHAGWLVAEGGRTVAQAARECGLSWPVAHQAFAASADPLSGRRNERTRDVTPRRASWPQRVRHSPNRATTA